MSVNIVKVKKTTLRTPLLAGDTTVKLSAFVDHKDTALLLASFGDWFCLVVKQGTNIEIIKCDGITQNANGTADVDIATNGRHLDADTPFAGTSTGLTFQTGEVIVTNDPYTVSQFASLQNEQTFLGKSTFPSSEALRPRIDTDIGDTAVDNAFVTFAQLARAVISGAVAMTTSLAGYAKLATKAQVLAGTADDGAGVPILITPDVLQDVLQGGIMIYGEEDGTGADDTYTWTTTPVTTALETGTTRKVKITVANTGACTGNENGIGAVAIKKYASGALADLETGDIIAGMTCYLHYDGTVLVLTNPTGTMPTTALLSEMATFFSLNDNDYQPIAGEDIDGTTTPQVVMIDDGVIAEETLVANPMRASSSPITFDAEAEQNAQSFTVPTGINAITKVSIEIWKYSGSPDCNLYVDLYAVDGSGKPTGSSLGTSNAVTGSGVAGASGTEQDFDFATPIAVTAGTEYVAVLRATDVVSFDGSNYFRIGGDQTSHDVHDGSHTNSTDSGATWSTVDEDDISFGFFGGVLATAGYALKASASTSLSDRVDAVGFVVGNISSGSPAPIIFSGLVGGFSGLTVGVKYYLSDTTGAIGTSAGTSKILIGRATSATTILIDIQLADALF